MLLPKIGSSVRCSSPVNTPGTKPMSMIVSAIVTVSDVPGGEPANERRIRSNRSPTTGATAAIDDDDGDAVGPAQLDAQEPVEVRRDHADRAVGEVEHAGGGVGQHDAAGGDREEAPAGDAEDGELEELAALDAAAGTTARRTRVSPTRRQRATGSVASVDWSESSAVVSTGSPWRDGSASTCRP